MSLNGAHLGHIGHPDYLNVTSPSPTDSQTSNDTTGNGDGPFDPGNTPPLVFAFIALGFTVFGLVIAIIYKRCRPLPSSQELNYRRTVPANRLSTKKPKLWDVWIPPSQHVPDEEPMKDVCDWDTFVVSSRIFSTARRPSSISRLISVPALVSVTRISLFPSFSRPYAPTICSGPFLTTGFLREPREPIVLPTTASRHKPPCCSHDLYAQTTFTTGTYARPDTL